VRGSTLYPQQGGARKVDRSVVDRFPRVPLCPVLVLALSVHFNESRVIDSGFPLEVMPQSTLPSATRLASEIRAKAVSPVDVARVHLDASRSSIPNSTLSWIAARGCTRPGASCGKSNHARRRSRAAARCAASIKSSIDVAGHRCESGSRLRAGNIASQDALSFPVYVRRECNLGVTNAPKCSWRGDDNLLSPDE